MWTAQIVRIAPTLNFTPHAKGLTMENQEASPMLEKSTMPRAAATMYPITIPINIQHCLIKPLPKKFKRTITTMTITAIASSIIAFSLSTLKLPNAVAPIQTPTVRTTAPVTVGLKYLCKYLIAMGPRINSTPLPTRAAPNAPPIPIFGLLAATTIGVISVKLPPDTMGSLAPICLPIPKDWIIVATPVINNAH